jgi:uncharacterized damage-inducible protein DinB
MMPDHKPHDISVFAKIFQHNTWANLTLLDFCKGLNDEQLDTAVIGGFGTIRNTLMHYVFAEVDYINLATNKWPPVIPSEEHFTGFQILKDGAQWAGDELLQLAQSAQDNPIVRVMRPSEPIYEFPLTGLMVQLINHSTEHRTQIASIITHLGIEPPSMSGWKYMRTLEELHEYENEEEGESSPHQP